MSKDTKKIIIFIVIGIIIVLAIIIPIVIEYKENKDLERKLSNIGNGVREYVEEKENAKSHIDEFSYNYETGKAEYHPTITLEMYNRIKEGMTKEEVIEILGKEDNIIENDDSNNYIVEYGNSYLAKGYWVQVIIDKSTDKVVKKYNTGLE